MKAKRATRIKAVSALFGAGLSGHTPKLAQYIEKKAVLEVSFNSKLKVKPF